MCPLHSRECLRGLAFEDEAREERARTLLKSEGTI